MTYPDDKHILSLRFYSSDIATVMRSVSKGHSISGNVLLQ